MCYYRKQARQGNVGLLCGYCNSIKRDLNPSEWAQALLFVQHSERLLLLTGTPGQGHAFTAAERRECLREEVSRICARKAAQAELK
jgi:hypothetical protein